MKSKDEKTEEVNYHLLPFLFIQQAGRYLIVLFTMRNHNDATKISELAAYIAGFVALMLAVSLILLFFVLLKFFGA